MTKNVATSHSEQMSEMQHATYVGRLHVRTMPAKWRLMLRQLPGDALSVIYCLLVICIMLMFLNDI